MQKINDIISIGRDLVGSTDRNGNETSWMKERLVDLEEKNTQLTVKNDERRKKLAQGEEFYTHSEHVCIITLYIVTHRLMNLFNFLTSVLECKFLYFEIRLHMRQPLADLMDVTRFLGLY